MVACKFARFVKWRNANPRRMLGDVVINTDRRGLVKWRDAIARGIPSSKDGVKVMRKTKEYVLRRNAQI